MLEASPVSGGANASSFKMDSPLQGNCSPREGLILEKLMKSCLLWEGLHTGAGKECEESYPEDEEVAETCYGLTATHCDAGGQEV